MIVEQYSRKSFPVDAVRVTVENLAEVAEWCNGEIHEDTTSDNPTFHPQYVKVRVQNPLTPRQTQAYVGDWVLYAGKGYKVYTNKAFIKSFTLIEKNDPEPMVANVFQDSDNAPLMPGDEVASVQNPGGTTSV